jgi:2-haloacid dehalogenase
MAWVSYFIWAARLQCNLETYRFTQGTYQPFGELTRCSFRHAAAEIGEELSPEQEERVMNAYNGLDAFPEVEAGLNLIAKTPGVEAYVFSNGTESMITSSLRTSPSLARSSSVLPTSRVVSVDPIRVFKPDQRTYEHFAKVAGLESQVEKLWLVSSNPFDALGARAAGWRSAWVNRNPDLGWIDGLSGAIGLKPTVIAKGVDDAVRKIIAIDIEGKSVDG